MFIVTRKNTGKLVKQGSISIRRGNIGRVLRRRCWMREIEIKI